MIEYELPEEKIPFFNSNFEEGNRLSEGITIIQGINHSKLGFRTRRKAKKAIKHYTECLNLIPNHWQTNWLIAKVYQVMSENKKALEHFEIAVNIEKTNPDLPREASISAMMSGDVELSVKYSLDAIKRAPDDAGLYSNHALHLIVVGDNQKALYFINKSLEMNPDDEISKRVFTLIDNVINEKEKRPKYNELY